MPRIVLSSDEEEVAEPTPPPYKKRKAAVHVIPVRSRRRHDSEDIEVDEQPTQSSRKSKSSKSQQRRAIEIGEEGDEESLAYAAQCALSDAVLAVFHLASIGPIKEVDLKPYLGVLKYSDWQDSFKELNDALFETFGLKLIYDGLNKVFFIRNLSLECESQIRDMFIDGMLDGEPIDDGFCSANRQRSKSEDSDDSVEQTSDEAMGILFAVLSAIMMSSNIELAQRQWHLSQESIELLLENMSVTPFVYDKLITGKLPELIKSGWLRRSEETTDKKEVNFCYYWGPRAIATVSTAALFEKFCIVNQTHTLEWGDYDKILRKLDERNNAHD